MGQLYLALHGARFSLYYGVGAMNILENPTLSVEKWGLHESTLFFLFCFKSIYYGYLPHRGGSNEQPKYMFGAK